MDKLDGCRQSRSVASIPVPLPVYDTQTDVIVPEIASVQEVNQKIEKDLVGGKMIDSSQRLNLI